MPKSLSSRAGLMAVVLGTALSTFGSVGTAQARTVGDLSRYCNACWRNARLDPGCWGDCTQEVFCRLLQRVPPAAWMFLLLFRWGCFLLGFGLVFLLAAFLLAGGFFFVFLFAFAFAFHFFRLVVVGLAPLGGVVIGTQLAPVEDASGHVLPPAVSRFRGSCCQTPC